MTAQLKRSYFKRSYFRKLFSETRANTKCWIIQELQTSLKNKAIKSLSSHQLSAIETKVLPLGHNFVPTHPASTHHIIPKLATHLIQTIKKQFHFRNQLLITKRTIYCKQSTLILPEPNFTNLTVFLKQTQNPLPNLSAHATRPNLTSQQRSALK